MSSQSITVSQQYFSGLTEQVFHAQLGVVDVDLVGYVAGLLVRFVRTDALYRIRSISGRPMYQVAEMLGEANARIGSARRLAHQHVGDFALFWVGVYPEALREMRSSRRQDFFLDYCAQGKVAYRVASSIETVTGEAPSEVLAQLSQQFEMCAYGLREVRREWEREGREELPRPLLY